MRFLLPLLAILAAAFVGVVVGSIYLMLTGAG